MKKHIVPKLRYQASQYASIVRGGSGGKHFLEEAADRIEELEAQLAASPQGAALPNRAYHDLIMWLLGENGSFPEMPLTHPGTRPKLYWWRTELRKRYEALQGQQSSPAPASRDEQT